MSAQRIEHLKDLGLQEIKFNINDRIGEIEPIIGKQGDYKTRGLLIQLLHNNAEIDTTGIECEFYATPKDGKVYFVLADEVDVTKGKYEVLYPTSIMQPGIVKAEIRFVKGEQILSTKKFDIYMHETMVTDDILDGTDERPLINVLIEAAKNEEIRIRNEEIREANEQIRQEAENERIEAENTRIQNENERKSNEQIRQQKEEERQQNEITRQTNEQTRQQNEQQRIDLYNALKDLDVSQYEQRLQKLEHDTSVEEFILEEAYGSVISLPSNVINGQINEIKIEGKTYRNVLEDYISDSNNWERLDGELIDNDFIKGTADGASYKNFWLKAGIITLKPNTQYTVFVEVRKNTLNDSGLVVTGTHQNDSFEELNIISPGETGIFKFLVTTKSDLTNTFPLRMFVFNTATSGEIEFRVMLLEGDYTNKNISYIRGTKSTLGAIRLKSVNEDETKEITLYVLGKDEEGNILELHSLPNGVKDEVNVSERKAIIRTKEVVLNGGENWSIYKVHENTICFQLNIPDKVMGIDNHGYVIGFNYVYYGYDKDEEGYSFSPLTNRVYININKNKLMTNDINGFKEWLSENSVTLIYQLAEPIEMPVEVFGSLQSYENGTVYVDTIIPRVDFYTSEGIVLEENEPSIKEIDALYLVDKETGVLTSLDTSKAFIFPDGKGFTHPDLYNDALVDWDYVPDIESTNPAISMKLPTNIKASINSLLDAENRNRKDIEWNKIKLGILEDEFNKHIENTNNPHNVTPDQIGALKQEDFNIHVSQYESRLQEVENNIKNLRDDLNSHLNIFPGIIVMWSGSLEDLPDGWVLCDGRNGTPDLRDKFILGADGTDIGDTGGSHTKTITIDNLPPHSHTFTTNNDGKHRHVGRSKAFSMSENPNGWHVLRRAVSGDSYDGTSNIIHSDDGNHTHSGTTNTTGKGKAIDIRPKYYKLAFIMYKG